MIRAAEVSDADRVAEIQVFTWRVAYRGLVADDFLYRQMTVVGRRNALVPVLEARSESVFVAEAEGLVVGFSRFPAPGPEGAELGALYVDPGFQRRGFGRQLLDHFLETQAQAQASRAFLWVFRDNLGSRAFYESMGFRFDGAEKVFAGLAPAVRYGRDLVP